jgi:hypothetical protein
MRAFWHFVHIFGYSIWIGGALAAMTLGIAGKRASPEQMGVVVRLQGSIYRALIGPGALATTLSGLVLTLQMYNQATAVGLSSWLMAMQGLGLIAAIIVFVVALPTSAKLSRLEPTGSTGPAFHGLRRRLVVAGMTSGTLAVGALVVGVVYRYG